MQIGEMVSSSSLQDTLQKHQTNVYLKVDNSLIDILCLAEKYSYIRHELPAQGQKLRIQVCSMAKVGQKTYGSVEIPLKDLPLRFGRLQEFTLPINFDGEDHPMTID